MYIADTEQRLSGTTIGRLSTGGVNKIADVHPSRCDDPRQRRDDIFESYHRLIAVDILLGGCNLGFLRRNQSIFIVFILLRDRRIS